MVNTHALKRAEREYRGQGKTIIQQMIKRLVFGVAAGALALSPSLPAQIGT